jgi:hypothetical protein
MNNSCENCGSHDCCDRENRLSDQIAEQAAEIERLKADYSELLYQVQQKIPGETRHETAKRIIRQHEDHQGDNPQQAMEDS